MTHRRPALLQAFSLSAALVSFACEKSDKNDVISVQTPVKVNDEALREKVESAKADLASKQRAFADEGRAQLNALDAKIDALKNQAGAKSEEAKRAADDALTKLKAQREEARTALERAESATREQWDAFKDSANAALGRAESAYNETLERLKTDEKAH